MSAKSARLRSRAPQSAASGVLVHGTDARFDPTAWGAAASATRAEVLGAAGAFARAVMGKALPGHLAFAAYRAASHDQVRADVEARLESLRAEP